MVGSEQLLVKEEYPKFCWRLGREVTFQVGGGSERWLVRHLRRGENYGKEQRHCTRTGKPLEIL